jgi:hypothetical protein
MLLLEAIEIEAEGGKMWQETRRLLRQADGAPSRSSHPAPSSRNDVLLFCLSELFTSVDHALGDQLRPVLLREHGKIWSESVLLHSSLMVEGARSNEASAHSEPFIKLVDDYARVSGQCFDDLSITAKLLAVRFLGELCGLGKTVHQGMIPEHSVLQVEKEIGSRILGVLNKDDNKWSMLGTFGSDLMHVLKFKGAGHAS